MGRTQLEIALAQLRAEIQKCENYKKRVLNYVENTKNKCLSREITYYDYEEILNRKLEGKTIKEWIDHYDSHIERLEKEIKKEFRKFKTNKVFLIFFSMFFISLIIFGAFYIKPIISGLFIKSDANLTDELHLEKIQEAPLKRVSPSQKEPLFSKIGGKISGISKRFYGAITGLIVEDVEDEVVEDEVVEDEEESIEEVVKEDLIEEEEFVDEEILERNESIEDPTIEEDIELEVNETISIEDVGEPLEDEEEESAEEIISQAPKLINSIPDLQIGKNEFIYIDLNLYFQDSEKYYLLLAKNISTTIINHTIRINPEENFVGTRTVKIIATNGIGTKESNFFNIVVLESGIETTEEPVPDIIPKIFTKDIILTTEENITEIIEFDLIENVSITTTTEFQIVIGKPVKWKKHILLEKPGITKIILPKGAENITVTKIIRELEQELNSEENQEAPLEDLSPSQEEPSSSENKTKVKKEKARVSITGIVISEIGEVKNTNFLKSVLRAISNFFRKGFATITGRVITTEELQEAVEVTIDDNATEYEIEYETPAPTAIEEIIGGRKRITISADDDLNYTNILAYTDLLEEVPAGKIRLYWLREKNITEIDEETNETIIGTIKVRELVDINKYDKNGNGLIDYIEWIVPHLSNQTYELIIEIIKAEHLDVNRSFISDIYNETYQLDGVWSETINNQEYIRVTFEVNLTSDRDITLWPMVVSGNPRVEVYEVNGTELIAEFFSLNENEYNKVFLDESSGAGLGNKSQNVFDLRVLGGSIELDHIIDPTEEFFEDCISYSAAPGIWTVIEGSWIISSGLCNNKNTGGAEDDLISSTIDLTGEDYANLSFDMDNQGVESGDYLRVYVNSSVESWQLLLETIDNNVVSFEFNISKNITMTTGVHIRFAILSDANNDKFNIDNVNLTSYGPPAIPPDINITFPAINNTNTTDTGYDVNYTVSDDVALSVCWWTQDGGSTNNTLASCTTNITGETWSEGLNTIRVYANDTSDNINSSEITFRLDTTVPDFKTANLSVLTNETGDPLLDFNATDNGIGTVSGFAINWTDTFNISFANGNLTNISAIPEDNYYINASVNDTLGNTNYTVILINVTNATVSNTAPQITNVSSIANIDPLEDSIRYISFNFTAVDDDGAGELNNDSVRSEFLKSGETTRINTTCTSENINSNSNRYFCTIGMWYFDANGAWTVNVTINDTSGAGAENSTTSFTYNLLTSMKMGPTALTWPGSLSVTSTNVGSDSDPITINNTGNDAITNITVKAIDLVGETNASEYIYAGNFTVNTADASDNTTMVNGTATQIAVANLTRGNHSANDNFTGQEQLYFYLEAVNSGTSAQSYSTSSGGEWTITILATAFVVGSIASRRKKKKKIISNVSIPSTIFSRNIGALETIVKYLKENLGMSYHKIAELLDRDQRNIWTVYNKAIQKQKELIKVKETDIFLPISIFIKELTVLESVVIYLKREGLKYSEISRLLNRDQRNIWTIYSKAVKKIKIKL